MLISRREFVRSCVIAGGTAAFTPVLRWQYIANNNDSSGPASRVLNFDRDWLFGGRLNQTAPTSTNGEHHFSSITLPHCVAKLGWENWDAADWQDLWTYRRNFTLP